MKQLLSSQVRTPPEGYEDYCGTFADNLKVPVHRWFKYPAGFSYKLIQRKIQEYSLDNRSWILDPFVGCGTTIVEAKRLGVNSVGIELHPFVHWVARIKTFWEFDLDKLHRTINATVEGLRKEVEGPAPGAGDVHEFPELLHKCYSRHNLAKLKVIRDYIRRKVKDQKAAGFLNLALTDTLRTSSKAGAGWPYIAPTRHHEKQEKDSFVVFAKQVYSMFEDLRHVLQVKADKQIECRLIKGDARVTQPDIAKGSMDLVITSPPYLNNYDYADRTRLELYFFGYARTWRDITSDIRSKLVIAATTQVERCRFDSGNPLSSRIRESCPEVHTELTTKIAELARVRLGKGGKKSYDYMVAGYFNDMYRVFEQVYHYLKRRGDFILVLGDSAPYGVHIPTEEYLGKLALGLGYSRYAIKVLRVRGNKWANNPQRHKVALKEAILQITK